MSVQFADLANPHDAARWDAYVREHVEGNFFQLSGWSEAVRTGLKRRPFSLWIIKNGRPSGLLPLIHVKSGLFGNALISTGFSVSGGPIANDQESQAELDVAAIKLACEIGATSIEYRTDKHKRADWLAKEGVYASFKRQISADADENLLAIPRKQRAVVRKALKGNLKCEITSDVGAFFRLLAVSYRNHGTPVFAKGLFTALARSMPDDVRIFTVTHEEKEIAAVMTFYFRDQVLPYFAGALPISRRLGAYDFAYWSIMEDARKRGLHLFDFGRSKVGSGSFAFKKNWGFEAQPLTYEFWLAPGVEMPNISPQNPKYQRLVRMWQRMPLFAANLVGPMISRSLG